VITSLSKLPCLANEETTRRLSALMDDSCLGSSARGKR
jgi:hypothetical protein